jgi:hypothetical protein
LRPKARKPLFVSGSLHGKSVSRLSLGLALPLRIPASCRFTGHLSRDISARRKAGPKSREASAEVRPWC